LLRKKPVDRKILSQKERLLLIEWLYVITGFTRSFWKEKSDAEIIRLYESNLEMNQMEDEFVR
jgi:hypothetical protein